MVQLIILKIQHLFQMVLLINKDIVASKLQVAIGYDPEAFNTFVREAQLFDFKPLVREEFFMDLIENKDEADWKKLIDGGDYEWNGRTYHFLGIDTILSYFAYSRFVLNSGAVSTSFGMVVKTNPNSQPLNLEERKNFYYKKQAEAGTLFSDLKSFVERNITTYPSWKDETRDCNTSGGVQSFKTKVIQ